MKIVTIKLTYADASYLKKILCKQIEVNPKDDHKFRSLLAKVNLALSAKEQV